MLGGALEDAPRRVEIIARIQHKFDPQAVTTPLLDLEVAAVGVDRAVGLLVEGDVVGFAVEMTMATRSAPGRAERMGDQFSDKFRAIPGIVDVATDQLNTAPMLDITIKREVASSYGILPYTIDNTLDDAFGQHIVSTIYTTLQQYHVILEVDPKFQYGPEALNGIYVKSSTGQQVPISTLVDSVIKVSPLVINHQGQFPSVTISFNLAPGIALGQAVSAIEKARERAQPATLAADKLPGQRPGVRSVAVEHAHTHRRGAVRHLSHPRHSVRERGPPGRNPLDPAGGRPRGAAAVDGGALRSKRDRHRRYSSAHRHRQEERHHAGRFRSTARTRRGPDG